MSFFQKIKDSITDIWPRRKTYEYSDIEAQDDSNKEAINIAPEPENKAQGLKKGLIAAALAGIFVVCATIFMTSFDDPAPKKVDAPLASNSKASNPAADMPTDYQAAFSGMGGKEEPKQAASQTPSQPPPQITPTQPPQQSNYVNTVQKVDKTAEYNKSGMRVAFASDKEVSSNEDDKSDPDEQPSISAKYQTKPQYYKSSNFQINAGTFLPATLLTGINSDMPGEVVGQIRENIYDSVSGRNLLIPQGSKLIGSFGGTTVGAGQSRIEVTWHIIILPDGRSFDLGELKSIDNSGYPGLKDKVNNHTWRVVRGSFLTSGFAAGVAYASNNGGGGEYPSPGQDAMSGALSNILNTGQKMAEKDMQIPPTIEIRPGTKFIVFVNKHFILDGY